ncbi:MAG: mechanosensitive ion channel [Flavobacteriales bacterium]|nr:mechanosensitive ion channel [Flavobacteriales bacterium]
MRFLLDIPQNELPLDGNDPVLSGLDEFLQYPIISNPLIRVSNLLLAVAIVVGSYLLLSWIRKIIQRYRKKHDLSIGQELAYYQLTKYIVVLLAFIMILEALNVQIKGILVGSAALLVGVGLGLQQLFNDIVSGFFLLMENTIRINDIIEVDGMVSKVREIGIRTSKVENRDGILVIIPNSKIVSNTVINWSTNGTTTRFSIKIGVHYESEVQKVKRVVLECAKRHTEVVNYPKPICRFVDFSDSALVFELLFWSKNRFRVEEVKSDLRYMLFSEFSKNGIRIPYPQRDLHIRSSDIHFEKGDPLNFTH